VIILDTDIMIDVLRGYKPALAWFETVTEEVIGLPGFVIMELLQGCGTKSEQSKLLRQLEHFPILWPSPEDCTEALHHFAKLRLSHNIGVLDVLIGRIASSMELPLHTFNEKHYQGIPGLQTVQPYKKS